MGLVSVGANAVHGLRRRSEDKRRAVWTLLNDSEWTTWPQTQLAQIAGVSREYVNRVWKEMMPEVSSCDRSLDSQRPSLSTVDSETARTFTTKHGTQATMQTSSYRQATRAPPTGTFRR